MTLRIENGTLLDTERMEIVGERHVTIEGDRIVDVDTSPTAVRADHVIDARGRFLLPGFVVAQDDGGAVFTRWRTPACTCFGGTNPNSSRLSEMLEYRHRW